jgi:hypothetical protein
MTFADASRTRGFSVGLAAIKRRFTAAAEAPGMDETYRMLGHEREADLAREAARNTRVADLERAGGITRAEAGEPRAERERGWVRFTVRRLIALRSA